MKGSSFSDGQESECVLSATGICIDILDDVKTDGDRGHEYCSSCSECPWFQLRESVTV